MSVALQAGPNPRFHTLTVDEVRRETPDAVSIRFTVPPHLATRFTWRAGQHLTLKTTIAGQMVTRNYSICASPLEGELRIAVKAQPGGVFSTYANESLKPGDAIEVMPPAGHFTTAFDPTRAAHYAAFAAGSGITPILSILKTALCTEPHSRFQLFYGNRASGRILFLEDLAALKNRFMARFEAYHFLSAEADEIPLLNGRLDAPKCHEILTTLLDPREVETFFICGPAGMMQAAEATLETHGVPKGKIRIERFSAAGTAPPEPAPRRDTAGRRFDIVLDGRTSTLTFDPRLANILDNARAAGLPAPFACKGGVCATCRARILAGAADMAVNYGLTPEEVAQGYILTCQSTPRGEGLRITYDI